MRANHREKDGIVRDWSFCLSFGCLATGLQCIDGQCYSQARERIDRINTKPFPSPLSNSFSSLLAFIFSHLLYRHSLSTHNFTNSFFLSPCICFFSTWTYKFTIQIGRVHAKLLVLNVSMHKVRELLEEMLVIYTQQLLQSNKPAHKPMSKGRSESKTWCELVVTDWQWTINHSTPSSSSSLPLSFFFFILSPIWEKHQKTFALWVIVTFLGVNFTTWVGRIEHFCCCFHWKQKIVKKKKIKQSNCTPHLRMSISQFGTESLRQTHSDFTNT